MEYDVAGLAASATRVPEVADAGAVAPSARRIITPVKDAPAGLVHDNAIEVAAGTALSAVTERGTFCRFSDRRRAVTTISSRPVPAEAAGWAAC